jgi:hypothetical protein
VEQYKPRPGTIGRKRKSDDDITSNKEQNHDDIEMVHNNETPAEQMVPTYTHNQTHGAGASDDDENELLHVENDIILEEYQSLQQCACILDDENEQLRHHVYIVDNENELLRVENDIIVEENQSLQHQVYILESELRKLKQQQHDLEQQLRERTRTQENNEPVILEINSTSSGRLYSEITHRDSEIKHRDERIRKLEVAMSAARNKLHKEQKNHSKTRKALKEARQQHVARSDEDAVQILFHYMNKQSKRGGRTQASVTASFARHLWAGKGLSESIVDHMRQSVVSLGQEWYAKNVFSPQNILRLMDLHGGTISMQAIDLLRSLETGDKKYVRGTVLPSSSSIGRCAKICELFASSHIPFVEGTVEGSGGEFVEFQFDELLVHAIDAFGLSDIAKRRAVEIHVSIDGAQITNNIVHITFGFKVADIEAVCPFTRRPLFMDGNPQLIQSRNLSIPVKIAIHKETAAIYKEFEHLVDQIVKFREPFLDSDDHALKRMGFQPLDIALNCDMSAMWKMLGVGGTAKIKEQPCHCCAIKSSDLLFVQEKNDCRWCCLLHEGDNERWRSWKCYHQGMVTENTLMELESKAKDLLASLKSAIPSGIDELREKTNIDTTEDPRVPSGTSQMDKHSIHFNFKSLTVTTKERNEYSGMLFRDLVLRKLPITGTIEERQQRLRESLIREWTLCHLQASIKHANKRMETCALFLIEAVPCILHLENRVGIKIFTLLLTEGLGNAKKGSIFTSAGSSENTRVDEFFKVVQTYCNQTVWGTVDCPSQWKCPRDGPRNDQIGEVSIENTRTRIMIENLSGLVDVLVPDATRNRMWKWAINNNYVPAIELLRQKSEFTDDEIANFQRYVDLFFQDWVDLHGKAGVTNYVHMLASGHISEYLQHWRNLYRHSQQGWESLNSMIKVFFFRRTQRGGKGRGEGKKSKLLPIARWLSRRAVWALGIEWNDIKSVVEMLVMSETESIGDDDVLNYTVA